MLRPPGPEINVEYGREGKVTDLFAALPAVLFVSLAAWPAAGEDKGPGPEPPPDCVDTLRFEAEGGKVIRIGLTGSAEAGVCASEEAVSALFQSPGGEFRILFSSGALKTIAEINKYRTDFFAKNRRTKGQALTPNCMATLRFDAKNGTLEGAYKPRKAGGFEIWRFHFNSKGKAGLVRVNPVNGDPPEIYIVEDYRDGLRSDWLRILPFDSLLIAGSDGEDVSGSERPR